MCYRTDGTLTYVHSDASSLEVGRGGVCVPMNPSDLLADVAPAFEDKPVHAAMGAALAAILAELPLDHRSLSREELSRSQANIREWAAYLPADCIARMIVLGWDVST